MNSNGSYFGFETTSQTHAEPLAGADHVPISPISNVFSRLFFGQNLIAWVQRISDKIDHLDMRFSALDNAHKVIERSEELHTLKQQDISAVVSAVDDMRYSDLVATVQNDKDKVAQLAADFSPGSAHARSRRHCQPSPSQ